MASNIVIGITTCGKFDNYKRWIEQEPGVEVVRLNYDDDGDAFRRCDGMLLSGGEDIHPRYYGKEEYLKLCHEIDEKRDALEWKALEHADKNGTPVLGICRGLQVVNVFFGGTLLPHVPAVGKFDHAKIDGNDRYHTVTVDSNSLLKKVVGTTEGVVNSAHHQAADRIARGLVANALSPDGIVEGLEREHGTSGSFLLLVQWHPERMKDLQSPFSKNIKETFLQAVRDEK